MTVRSMVEPERTMPRIPTIELESLLPEMIEPSERIDWVISQL